MGLGVLLLCGCGQSASEGTQDYKREERPFAVMDPVDLPADKWTEVSSTDFSIKIPKSWKSIETSPESSASEALSDTRHKDQQLLGYDPAEKTGYADSVMIMVSKADEGATLDSVIDKAKAQIKIHSVGTTEYAEVQPPAGKFARIKYSSSEKALNAKKVTVTNFAYIGLVNGKEINVTFSSMSQRARDLELTAYDSMTSLKVK